MRLDSEEAELFKLLVRAVDVNDHTYAPTNSSPTPGCNGEMSSAHASTRGARVWGSINSVSGRSLQRLYVLFFIELGSRRVLKGVKTPIRVDTRQCSAAFCVPRRFGSRTECSVVVRLLRERPYTA